MKIVDSVDKEQWDEFVFNHPHGNIFQTNAMFEVYKNTERYLPKVFFALNKNNDIVGLISGVGISEVDGFASIFSRHGVVQGGPLFTKEMTKSDINKLVSAYDSSFKKYLIYNDFRNMWDVSDTKESFDNYCYQEHLDYLINLNRSEEEIWKEIHKPRRKNITRSEKQGVVIEEMNNTVTLSNFYRLINDTYSNVKLPVPDISLFKSAIEILVPNNYAKFYIAKTDDGKEIGCRAVLTYKEMVYDWYAGADRNALDAYPNDILVWHTLKWGSSHGYKVFDFGGAGEPNKPYGPREFKRRFGGKLVNYGRFTNIYSPIKYKIANIGMHIYRRIK